MLNLPPNLGFIAIPAKARWGLGVSILLTVPMLLLSSGIWKAIPITGKSPKRSFTLVQTNGNLLQQGNTLSLEGKTFPVNWVQWQQDGQIRTGISDLGAMQVLGFDLLDSNQPQVQPSQWFSMANNLNTQFIAPYRYLDLTEWLQQLGSQVQPQGDTLALSSTGSQVTDVREGNQPWGKRIVLTLSRPAFWQVSQAKTEGVVMLNAAIAPNLLTGNASHNSPPSNEQRSNDEDDLGSPSGIRSTKGKSFRLEKMGSTSKIYITLPTANKLQILTLPNPDRLVIDIRPDAPPAKTIAWAEGVTWRQQFINIGGSSRLFPVTWLELNLASPQISIKPLTANPQGLMGIVPTASMVRSWQASAGINGGFFNRNTQLPLGAIKRDNRWLSGPILNRGAIAWDDNGNVTIGRLSLQESLTTNGGQTIAVDYLNSGYVQKGVARYTSDWGTHYRPMTDNETIIVVQDNQVIAQQPGGKSGQNPFPIPTGGYLIALRGNSISPNLFAVGTALTLQSSAIPAKFNAFPHLLGAGPLMIDRGQIVLNAAAEKFNAGFQRQRASRSAIAVHGSGKVMLVAVHNRVGGAGATLAEMALILKQLGAESALNLDGGSSTSLALGGQLIDRSAVTAARVNNGLGLFIQP